MLWQLEVNASTSVEHARRDLAAGKHRAAARAAWKAVSLALSSRTTRDDRLRKDAEHLAAYCHALLDGAGGGIRARTVVETIFMRDPSLKRRALPDVRGGHRGPGPHLQAMRSRVRPRLSAADDELESPSPHPSAHAENGVAEP
jgi:hypothetical protein